MKIKSMKLRNFLSFEKADITLHNSKDDPPSLFIVTGKNYDQLKDSDDSRNGAGKSSFLCENLVYNIYGKPLRGGKGKVKIDDLIKKGHNEMLNEIVYYVEDNSELKIERTRNDKGINTVKIELDRLDISRRTKKLSDKNISDFLNISFDVFSQCIVNYADTTSFMYMNYSNKLELIKQIIELSFLDELSDKSKLFFQTNEKFIKTLELNKKHYKEYLSLIRKNKNQQIELIESKISSLKKEGIDIDEEIKILPSIKIYDDEIKKLELEIKKIREEMSEYESKQYYYQSLISKYKKESNELKKLSSSKCPKCFQFVEEKYVNEFTEMMNISMLDAEEMLNKFVEMIESKREEESNNDKLLKIKKKEKESLYKKSIVLKTKEESIKKDIKKLERELKEINIDSDDVDNESIYEKKLNSINKALKLRNEWRESSSYFNNIFNSKSSLKSAIYKNYIVILSDMFEYYMNKVFNGQMIGTINIDNDSNIDPIFIKDKQIIPYWLLSSGERRRVDLSLCLAFFEFVSYSTVNMPKFLVLDEPFSNLDTIGIKECVSVLADIHKRHNLDIFIVTHTTFPYEILDQSIDIKKIEIMKKNNISTVKIS